MCAILHEEIDRLPEAQRLPVVFCDLEGLTYEQAAGRLRCSVPALYHRLEKGRKRLRDRLVRRGVTAVAMGAVLECSRASSAAAISAVWANTAMAAATGGPIAPAVAALTHSLFRSLLVTQLKMMTVAALALGTLISAGVVALAAARPDAAKPRSSAALPPWCPRPSPTARSLRLAQLAEGARSPSRLATWPATSSCRACGSSCMSGEGTARRRSASTDASGTASSRCPPILATST